MRAKYARVNPQRLARGSARALAGSHAKLLRDGARGFRAPTRVPLTRSSALTRGRSLRERARWRERRPAGASPPHTSVKGLWSRPPAPLEWAISEARRWTPARDTGTTPAMPAYAGIAGVVRVAVRRPRRASLIAHSRGAGGRDHNPLTLVWGGMRPQGAARASGPAREASAAR